MKFSRGPAHLLLFVSAVLLSACSKEPVAAAPSPTSPAAAGAASGAAPAVPASAPASAATPGGPVSVTTTVAQQRDVSVGLRTSGTVVGVLRKERDLSKGNSSVMG